MFICVNDFDDTERVLIRKSDVKQVKDRNSFRIIEFYPEDMSDIVARDTCADLMRKLNEQGEK